MSRFNELIPNINEISNKYTKNFQDDLKVILGRFDNFEDEFRNGRHRGREKSQKDKLGTKTLQSINEDDDKPEKLPESKRRSKSGSASNHSSIDSSGESRASKKRSKNEVDDMLSPEVDKRQKRNASVKAQSIITQQVNVNLTAKLRRENSNDKLEKTSSQSSRSRRRKDDEKENSEPNAPAIQIKEEKVSLPPEPMDMEALPIDIPIKEEVIKDDIAMPPPTLPVPKPRKGIAKEKSEDSAEEETGSKRPSRTKKKPVEDMPPPPVAATRATRASSRATRQTESEDQPPAETRPKRTRAKKKVSVSETQSEVDGALSSQESVSATASPAEKPRPKRTRRGKADKQPPKPVEQIISPKQECNPSSPILQKDVKYKNKNKTDVISTSTESAVTINSTVDKLDLEETRIISKDMDRIMVLPNGVYKHDPITPKNVHCMNETVVIEKANNETSVMKNNIMEATVVIEKLSNETRVVKNNNVMDSTVIIEKGLKSSNLTEDNSLITDDESEKEIQTPPKKDIPQTQPLSAVKVKVQQFEEMATRVTRTKTRAMAKKEEQTENHTPPDKVSKPILSAETLNKMNSLIFNGKPPQQISSSASKPRAAAPVGKSHIPSSTSKISSLSKHKEAAEETLRNRTNEEDARKKKEAMLDAKREHQKRKREEKMAAAAAARSHAERERKVQLELAAKERMEKQAHADAGKLERMKEAERKKHELARKVAETEERRKAEEAARMQRLAEEQRKALAQRRKQIEEQEAMKKEAAIMAKEIEKRQKEYMDKQRIKSRIEDKMHTPLKTPGTPGGFSHPLDPVHMADGFQYLNSDEDEESQPRHCPEWSTYKARKRTLDIQSHISAIHIDRLFSVRVHVPDLREIFPNIERTRLKRTSSAVWRTPPQQLRTVVE